MICPICEQDLEIIEKEVDIFEDDSSGIVKYAVCRDCRKQWKLKNTTVANKKKDYSAEGDYKQIRVVGEDKQAAPPDLESLLNAAKASQRTPPKEKSPRKVPGREPEDREVIGDDSRNPAKSTVRNKSIDRPGKRSKSASLAEDDKPDNKQRKTSRDSGDKSKEKPRHPSRVREGEPKNKPRHISRAKEDRPKDKPRHPSQIGADGSRVKQKHPSQIEDKRGSKNDRNQPSEVTFKPIRIGFGILSVLACLYLFIQGYFTYYLNFVRFRGAIPISMTVAVFMLGLFCLIAGIFLFVTLKKEGVIPFIVPSFLYLLGGVIAFFLRGESRLLLSGAIIALIVAIVLIILVLIDKIKNVEEE